MKHIGSLLTATLLVACCWGCNTTTPGDQVSLGDVNYQAAFAGARQVMRTHFPVASADPESGVIRSRPVPADPDENRILGGTSPARKVATMKVQEKEGEVFAHLSVAIQQQESSIHRVMPNTTGEYDAVPDETPAQMEAATTAEQNESWITRSYDSAMQRRMLEELYLLLRPSEKKPAATE
ncbi:MAG: hypothetical protein ACLFVU_00375 [Phycisphaerae bacterium]